jgi:hypothetical protein
VLSGLCIAAARGRRQRRASHRQYENGPGVPPSQPASQQAATQRRAGTVTARSVVNHGTGRTETTTEQTRKRRTKQNGRAPPPHHPSQPTFCLAACCLPFGSGPSSQVPHPCPTAPALKQGRAATSQVSNPATPQPQQTGRRLVSGTPFPPVPAPSPR